MMKLKWIIAVLWNLGIAATHLTAAETTVIPMQDGALIQGSGGVFTMQDGVRLGIPSMEIFTSHGFDGSDVTRVTDAQLQTIPEGALLTTATPEQVAKQADQFPQFIVPGQHVALDRLRDIFRLHHSPKTEGTFETPYLLPSVLWPALGTNPSAEKMRRYYRASLLSRKIDAEGYVTTNQHRGHAHDDGWPFPTWVQSGGAGWLFSHLGDPYSAMFKLPLFTSLDGWESTGVTVTAHDPNAGLQLTLGNHATLTSPTMNVDSLVAPFIAILWKGTLPPDSKPFLEWTTDVEFLRGNLARMRQATDFAVREFGLEKNGVAVVPWVGHDGRPGLTVGADGKKISFPGRGVGNNYWDLLPFGGQDAFLTITMFHALKRVASLEAQITRHPEWKLPAMISRVASLKNHVIRLQSEGSKKFWDTKNGRFVGWIDSDGKSYDYGFTFLNLEAIRYGFASADQAKSIMDWLSGKREVAGDTSKGADIYHWRFAPRATTLQNIDCYGWVWSSPESIPWGYQVQDGGAVLGFSFYDLMSRLQVNGPDDAWQRLQQITDWFGEVQAAGGYRAYYQSDPKRGTLQGGGPPGGLGMDQEFMESVLLPQVMLYGFLGFTPQPDGFRIVPKLPTTWPSLTVTRIAVQDSVLDVTARPASVEMTCRKASSKPLLVSLAAGDWQLAITSASGEAIGKPTQQSLKTAADTIPLTLSSGQQAKFTRQQ